LDDGNDRGGCFGISPRFSASWGSDKQETKILVVKIKPKTTNNHGNNQLGWLEPRWMMFASKLYFKLQ